MRIFVLFILFGLRGPLFGDDDSDLQHDKKVGFKYITSEDIDEYSPFGANLM
jgi:hypothetical protein